MLNLGLLGNIYFKQAAVRAAINSRLAQAGYPEIGPLYRICPAPRVTVGWLTARLTVYLQYLPSKTEIALSLTSSNPQQVTVQHIQTANPSCL